MHFCLLNYWWVFPLFLSLYTVHDRAVLLSLQITDLKLLWIILLFFFWLFIPNQNWCDWSTNLHNNHAFTGSDWRTTFLAISGNFARVLILSFVIIQWSLKDSCTSWDSFTSAGRFHFSLWMETDFWIQIPWNELWVLSVPESLTQGYFIPCVCR